jgi:hypothetical protein
MGIETDALIAARYEALKGVLDERLRRLFAAAEAKALGHGGVKRVNQATGVARGSILAGIKELELPRSAAPATLRRIRRPGAGRKKVGDRDPGVRQALQQLVEPITRGDPEPSLRWTCKSLMQLAHELGKQGHAISHVSVGVLLKEMGYRLEANRKTLKGASHPDRNAQFEYINDKTQAALAARQPVIAVDTKKKEFVGSDKDGGKPSPPEGNPELVELHDFVDTELGRANPYGVYGVSSNNGWVRMGTDHATSSFAVATIRRWWNVMGRAAYPAATELTIMADGGGSNGAWARLGKLELQRLANELHMAIHVCHFPPGTSKWNKIEHRLVSYISMNWRGQPWVSHEAIVNLIAATTTRKGLKLRAEVDSAQHQTDIKGTDAEFDAIQLTRDAFHGEWNYVISPTQ